MRCDPEFQPEVTDEDLTCVSGTTFSPASARGCRRESFYQMLGGGGAHLEMLTNAKLNSVVWSLVFVH